VTATPSTPTTPSIQAVPLTIEDLFKDTYAIPDYQREYRWENKHLLELWADLTALTGASGAGLAASGSSVHYLGTIYCEQHNNQRDLIDGQQRLTTLQLLWGVLQAHAAELTSFSPASTEAGELNTLKSMLESALYDQRKGKQYLRVVSNYEKNFAEELLVKQRDRASRSGILSSKTEPKALIKAYSQLDEILQDDLQSMNDSAKLDRLRNLYSALSTQMKLVRIDLSGSLRVHEIFGSLNAKGRPLDTFELVKSYLFGKASAAGTLPSTMSSWNSFIKRFREHKLKYNEILHYCVSGLDAATTDSSVFKKAKPFIDANPDEFAQNLDAFSKRVFDVYSIDPTLSASGKESAFAIRMFGYDYAYMLVGATHPIPLGDPDLNNFLLDLENYLFRFLVVHPKDKRRVTQMQKLMKKFSYEALASWIPTGAANFRNTLLSELKGTTQDASFVSAFSEYSESRRDRQEYVLRKYEMHYINLLPGGGGLQPKPIGINENHIEHIYPKNPHDGYDNGKGYDASKDNWLAFRSIHDPHAPWDGNDARKEFFNRIGNLMILESSLNRSIQNKDINVKVQGAPAGRPTKSLASYQVSKLQMPQFVCIQASTTGKATAGPFKWEPNHVRNRQKEMAKIAPSIWQL